MKNSFLIRSRLSIAAIAALFVAFFMLPSMTLAATANYGPATSGIVSFTFQYDGQFTTTTAGVTRFAMPFKARALSAQASCNTIGGTATPTLSVDVNDDATTILSADIAITTADTVVFGTLATPAIADESEITIDFAITGTNPTFDDCTVVLTVIRE